MRPSTRLTGLFGSNTRSCRPPWRAPGGRGCAVAGPEAAEGFCLEMRRLTSAPFHLNLFLLPSAPEPQPARMRLLPEARAACPAGG
jgi:hypothetical protein